MGMTVQRGSRTGSVRPLYTVAGLVVLGGAIGLWQRRPEPAVESSAEASPVIIHAEAPAAPALSAAQACSNVGYLCSELSENARIQIHRWKDFEGTIVVHVPRPDFEDAGNIALVAQKAQIVSLRRHLTHDARFARWHLADDRC